MEKLFAFLRTRSIRCYAIIGMVLLLAGSVNGQVTCDPNTPVFDVDLSGQPNGVWLSTSVVREGYCCTANGNDVCIRFNLLLDSAANGINFSVASGAVPGGALFYQINCGPPQMVGVPICLDGPGPHVITFCKPGNNQNTYQIQSLPKPYSNAPSLVTQSCEGTMSVVGLDEATVQWTSIPPNATYNSFINCPIGCDTVTITPSINPPPFIDYQVSGSVTNGCVPLFFVDTIRVYMEDALNVQIAPQNHVICWGNPPPTLTANVTGGRPPYSYLWNTGATTASITGAAGVYTVFVVDSMNCTTATSSTTIQSFTAPITSNAGNDTIVCSGMAPIQLSGSVTGTSTAEWLGGNGTFTPNRQTLNATYTPTQAELNNGTIQLILSNTNTLGCPGDRDTVLIRVLSMPAPVLTGPSSACETETSVFWLTTSGAYTVTWNVSGGTIINNTGNAITVLWGPAGPGTVTVTESNQGLCTVSASSSVNILTKPLPVINASATVCAFSTSIASILTTQPGTTYTWQVTGGTINGSATGTSINIQWSRYGTGTISVIATNNYGCVSDTSVNVTILSNPQISFGGPASVCQDEPTFYQATYISGAQYAWTVNGGSANSTTGSSISVTWTQPGQGTLSLNVIGSNGCDTSITYSVQVNPKAVPVISGLNSSCIKTLQTYVAVNAQQGHTYFWNVVGGTILGTPYNDTIQVRWTNIGNSTVSLTETTPAGCDSTAYFSVSISPLPVPQLNGDPSVCQFETVPYRAPQIPGHVYRINIANGQLISHNNDTLLVNWMQEGTGSIQLTVEYPDGCDSTITFTVQVGKKPDPQLTGPLTLCEAETGVYLASTLSGSFVQWNISNGIPMISGNGSTASVRFTIPGNAMIQVTEITAMSCSTTVVLPVNILSRPHPILSGAGTGCIGSSNNRYDTGLSSGLHQWTVTGGSYQLLGNAINVIWYAPGNHTVSVRVMDPVTGCDSVVSMNVLVDSLARPQINAGTISGCAPLSLQFAGNLLQNGYTYNWNFGNSTNSSAANPLAIYDVPGTYSITLIAGNATGCTDTVTASINVFPSPVADFTATINTGVNLYDPSYLTLSNQSQDAYTWYWDFGNGDTSYAFEPSYQYTTYGDYPIHLYVENTYGCRDTAMRMVEIRLPELLHIPNAFTPNHDGKNDHWSVKGENITQLEVTIFNRWGQPIYNASSPDFEWDGMYNGRLSEGGVYIYKLNATGIHGMSFEKTGKLTLVR